jgi:hypothetical protein
VYRAHLTSHAGTHRLRDCGATVRRAPARDGARADARGSAPCAAGPMTSGRRACMSVGEIASFISTVSAPPTPRSSAVTGSPARVRAPRQRAPRPRTMRGSRRSRLPPPVSPALQVRSARMGAGVRQQLVSGERAPPPARSRLALRAARATSRGGARRPGCWRPPWRPGARACRPARWSARARP